jgi:hypothetical protein
MAANAPHRIKLYGKPECHLCDIAYDLVRGLAKPNEWVIEKIDITKDPRLWQKYHDKIPVLVINDRVTLTAPIRTADVRRALTERR